ncbi:MAG: DUF2808 domain-containing protein [Synechocystis sp.]|jgi:hypothetical protein
MLNFKFSKHLFALLALSGALVTGLPAISWAGGNAGLTIFSGVERSDILDYYLQFGGRPGERDRYKLYIPAKKMTQGAKVFYISYPENFDGKFSVNPDGTINKNKIRVETQKQGTLEIEDVVWDKESRFLQIVVAEPAVVNSKVTITLSNVTNPTFGTYYLVSDVMASGDIPVRLYVGTWIVDIQR